MSVCQIQFADMGVRRSVVQDLASRGRLDVHRLHSELVRHLAGPVCGRHAAGHLSEHHVDEARQIAGGRCMGVVVCDLFSAAGGAEQ